MVFVNDEELEQSYDKLLNKFISKLNDCREELREIMFSRESTVDTLIDFLVHIFDELYLDIKTLINEKVEEKLEDIDQEKEEIEEATTPLPISIEGLPIICPHCKKNIVESVHHIVPRKYGGITTEDNIITLCNRCHDLVEICTDELFKKRKRHRPTLSELKFYIQYGFPNEEEIKKEMKWYLR